ncbi:MAG: FtsX-like permease family protein [Phycisphaerae bacterium]|nr:FtsX-like permease family protein [Phycisphaerae bacterium]
MSFIALKILFGDRTKYITLVLGLAFAALLMNQQGAIFLGLCFQATGPLQNVSQADLWVTDPGTQWVAEYRPLSDEKLSRVRSAPGVAWAEPMFNAWAVAELKDGTFKRCQILGLPRSTLVGRPPEMVEGRLEDLWIPDAIIVEELSAKLMDVKVGDVLKINDRRALVVGTCRAKRGFESNAIMYSTFDNAVRFTPTGRERISYILVKLREGADLERVRGAINSLGDVVALTRREFQERSIRFIIIATGIGVNFGITIALGFVVGLLLSASIFYQFTIENLRHFAVLKALGATAPGLVGMVLLQAAIVGCVGFGIGAGAAGIFTLISRSVQSELSAYFPWQLLAGSFIATLLTIGLGSLLSIRRVLRVSPGVVFGGA